MYRKVRVGRQIFAYHSSFLFWLNLKFSVGGIFPRKQWCEGRDPFAFFSFSMASPISMVDLWFTVYTGVWGFFFFFLFNWNSLVKVFYVGMVQSFFWGQFLFINCKFYDIWNLEVFDRKEKKRKENEGKWFFENKKYSANVGIFL